MELTLEQALQKGVEAHKAGKVQEADQYYTAILQAQPTHPDANHNMGVLAVGVGKADQALPFFKKALEANSTVEQFWISYIDALIKLGRMEDAKVTLDQAKRLSAKGDNLHQIEKKLGSLTAKSSNIQEPPSDQFESLINQYTQGQYQEALNKGIQLLQQFPDSINLYNITGAANQRLGKLDEAIEAYKKVLSLKPDYADAHFNLGNALQEQGKLDEAIEAYKKVLALKPDYADAYNNMGHAHMKTANFKQAKICFEEALRINPNQNKLGLSLALHGLGRYEEAIEAVVWKVNKPTEFKNSLAKEV